MQVARRGGTLLAALLAAGFGCSSLPQEEQILRQALARRGGAERLAALAGVRRSYGGTYRGLPVAGEVVYRPPNQLRATFRFLDAGAVVIQVFDGRIAYQEHEGARFRLFEEEAYPVRNQALDETVFWLDGLNDPNLTVAAAGEGIYRERRVASLRVEHWTGYSRLLHFDAETFDLLGSEGLTWSRGAQRPTEYVYRDYQEIEGLRVPMAFEVHEDGEKVLDARHVQISFSDIPPASAFDFASD